MGIYENTLKKNNKKMLYNSNAFAITKLDILDAFYL